MAVPFAPGSGDRLPRWMVLALPPFVMPAAAALYLGTHWSEIPERFPIHWGANGQPNCWATRTPHTVYAPLLFGAGLLLLMLLMALATFYGSHRAPQRDAALKLLVAVMYLLGLVFTGVGLLPVLKVSPAVFLFPAPVFAAGILAWAFKFTKNKNHPVEATSDEYWRGGVFYYNPNDPAIFVPKRRGFGYTCNFANRLSWIIMGAFLGGLAGLIVFVL